MENFIPAYTTQKQAWMPALKAFGTPLLALGGIIALEMGNVMELPKGAPAGIINRVGICYIASAIQAMDAAKWALKGALEPFLGAKLSKTLNAYHETHKDLGVIGGVSSCIDPEKLVKIWIETHPEQYQKPIIIKQVRQHDGSIREEEMFPDLVGTGAGGDPAEIITALLNELDERSKALNKPHPFALKIKGKKMHEANILHYDVVENSGNKDAVDFVTWKDNIIQSAYQIVKAPKLLMLQGLDHATHTVPLNATLRDATGEVGSYRLLSVIFGLPVIKEKEGMGHKEGFVGNHAIAVVRYGDTWYECDNHKVTPFADERSFIDMMDLAARTHYVGSGMPATAIPFKHPMLVLYELQ